MNKLNELIHTLCPNGVEYKMLSDVARVERGKRVVREQLSSENGFPVFQNSLTPMGYHTDYNYEGETPYVIGAGAAGEIGYSTELFWAADDCFPIVCDREIHSRYIFHVLKWQQDFLKSKVRKASIPRLARDIISNLTIPVPPLPVQDEIARILDNFLELTAELTAHLTTEFAARRQQYEYYNNILLSFDNAEYKTLEELCDIVDYRGKTPRKVDNGIFLVTAKNIRKGFIDYDKSKEYIPPEDYDEAMRRGFPKIGDVLITTEAPCGNVAQIDNENVALAQRVIKYRPKSNNLNSTFLKYVLLGKEFQDKLERAATGGTVKGIKGSKLHQLTIPVPSIEEQERIVSILEHFDTLCNAILANLPEEIEARQKQYVYYRDKLLSFKERE